MGRDEWWIARLLRLYPRELRAEHGEEMRGFLRAQRRESRYRSLGALGALRFAWDVIGDALRARLGAPATPPHDPGRMRTSVGSRLRDGGAFFRDPGLGTDVRAAFRSLRRRPGFTLVAVLTLALGMGAGAAVFGIANQVLLRPLPGVSDPGRAAYLEFRDAAEPGRRSGVSPLDFEDLRRAVTLLEAVAAYSHWGVHVSVPGSRLVDVWGNLIHGDFFEALGVRPSRGRLLAGSETGPGADPSLVVISERLWGSLLGHAPDVVGRTLVANGRALTIVGVAGGGFSGPERRLEADMWLPYAALAYLTERAPEALWTRGSTSREQAVARPLPGVPLHAAQGELERVMEGLAAAGTESAPHLATLRPTLFPGLHTVPRMREATYRALGVLAGVVALVLLIACANVANLLLFRGVERRGDVAVRRALGASPARVSRQHLVESLLLALLAALAGLAVAWLIALPFRGESILGTAPLHGFRVDVRVLGFAAAAVALTALLFGALPAALAGRFDLGSALRDAGDRDTARRGALRRALSAAQLALSLALLVGALLLVRTVRNLHAVETGLELAGVAALHLDPRAVDYGGPEFDALHRRLLAAVRSVPGVESVALDVGGALGPRMGGRAALPPGAADGEPLRVTHTLATPEWFGLLGVAAISGRTFEVGDLDAAAPRRAVLTAPLARRLFGRTDVAGRTVLVGFAAPEEAEVVGVVGDVRLTDPRLDPEEHFFLLPYAGAFAPQVRLLVRTRRFDAEAAEAIRAAVESVVPELPVHSPALLTDRLAAAFSEQRVFARLLGLLSGLSVLLAAVGLYGVVAFTVAARRRELGIRLALGADGARLAGLVVGYAARIVVPGVGLGLLGAYALSRALESRLFGVEPVDAASYAGAALLFTAVAALACWLPMRAASRADPVVALKGE